MRIGEFEKIVFAEPEVIPQKVPQKVEEVEEPVLVPTKKDE